MYFAIGSVYLFKIRNAKHKKTSQVSFVFHDEFVHDFQCDSMKCKERNHEYCVTSGDSRELKQV